MTGKSNFKFNGTAYTRYDNKRKRTTFIRVIIHTVRSLLQNPIDRVQAHAPRFNTLFTKLIVYVFTRQNGARAPQFSVVNAKTFASTVAQDFDKTISVTARFFPTKSTGSFEKKSQPLRGTNYGLNAIGGRSQMPATLGIRFANKNVMYVHPTGLPSGRRLTVVTARGRTTSWETSEGHACVLQLSLFSKTLRGYKKTQTNRIFSKTIGRFAYHYANSIRHRRVDVFPAQWKTNAYSLLLFVLKLTRTKIKHVRLWFLHVRTGFQATVVFFFV